MTAALQNRITAHFDQGIKTLDFLDHGNNTVLYKIVLSDARVMVAKYALPGAFTKLSIEGWMLSYLKDHSELPVPEVFFADDDLLVMDYVDAAGGIQPNIEIEAAEKLAAIHAIKAKSYGLERDTLIGPLDQPNQQDDDWISFFSEQRLWYMGSKALQKGLVTSDTMNRLERFCIKLPVYLEKVPRSPSLIHGDVWGGNILVSNIGISAFIDPAIYYADPEIELAFSTLFGTFGEPFFKRYNEIHPIEPCFFEERRDIYNLYPLLVHLVLFGGSYLSKVESILSRYIKN